MAESWNAPTVTREDSDALELLLDKTGLDGLLDALVDICEQKAHHADGVWQDRVLAKDWIRKAKLLAQAASRVGAD